MKLTNEEVAARFSADEIVGAPASVPMGGSFGGEGFGGVGPDTYVATSSGVYGRLGDVRSSQAAAVAGSDEVAGTQSGGRRRRGHRRSYRRHRKTQRGGARRASHVSTSVRSPRLNVSIRARIRLSRRSRQ